MPTSTKPQPLTSDNSNDCTDDDDSLQQPSDVCATASEVLTAAASNSMLISQSLHKK